MQGKMWSLIVALAATAFGLIGPLAGARGDDSAMAELLHAPPLTELLRDYWRSESSTAALDWSSYGRLRDGGGVQQLSLGDCVTLALQNNTDLQVERLSPLEASAGVLAADAIFDPVLFADANKTRAVTPSNTAFNSAPISIDQKFVANLGIRKLLRSGASAELRWTNNRNRSSLSILGLDPEYRSGLALSLNQPLLRSFGLRYATILVRVAETTELQALRGYEARVATIVKAIEDAYWDLLLARQNITVEARGLDAARELLRQNQGKFDVGALPRTAVLEAKSAVANRRALLVRAENRAVIARDRLRAMLNVGPSREKHSDSEGSGALILIEPEAVPPVPEMRFDLDESLERARIHRPELQAAALEVRARALDLRASANQLLPRVDAVTSIGVNGLSGDAVPEDRSLFPEGSASPFAGGYDDALSRLGDGRFYSYTAGITIEVPIGNALSRASYAGAKIDLERARLDFRRLQQGVTLEVKTAINNLESDVRSIEATTLAHELAAENVRSQQARYDVGLATTKDLLDFQRQLTLAAAAEIEAMIRFHADLSELRRAEGRLLEAHNVVIDLTPKSTHAWWSKF